MAPSASPSPASAATQTQARSSGSTAPNGTPNGIPAILRRPKKEINLFQKNPSKPFGLRAMQAANGTATPPAAARAPATTSPANHSTVTRASPIPKVPNATTGSSTPEQRGSPSAPSTPSNSQASTSAATPSNTASGDASTTTNVPYQDFRIVSTDLHGWKYDVMKFDSRKPVDVNVWARPVKLNRKEIRRTDSNANEAEPVAVGPMLGPDGKPVVGADGRVVMVDAEGKPIHENRLSASSISTMTGANGKNGKDDKNKRRKFQRKTRQVFLIPDHIRQLRREERYPWVMEDASGKEVWEGRMEEASKAELYALFMPAPDSVFRFVPAHRWYKFQKRRPQQQTWTLEEAERMMAKKNKDGERWLMRRRINNNSTNGEGAAPAAGGLGGGTSLVHDVGGISLAPGGRRLRTVDDGMRGLFEEDDEEGSPERRRRKRERDFEGDMDEMEYEEDFADDEEKMEPDDVAADEEAKELEERIKREYRQANKTREGYVDETDEEEEEDNLTGTGKDIKKLVRKIEKNAAYDSDEDKNPYASSEEEEEEEVTPTATPSGPAVQDQSQSNGGASRPGSVVPQSKPGSRSTSKPPSRPSSRSGSPAPPPSGGGVKVKTETPGSPTLPPPPSSSSSSSSPAMRGMGGHSVVAKRATSPKAPKLKSSQPSGVAASGGGIGSRATSPLAGRGGSRAGSPNPVTPTSQGAVTSRGATPGGIAVNSPSKKRKADGEVPVSPTVAAGGGGAPGVNANANASAGTGGAQPNKKKRKSTMPPGTSGPGPSIKTEGGGSGSSSSSGTGAGAQVSPGTQLTREVLVAWLRSTPSATTRDCIHYFQPALADEDSKTNFTTMVKEVASLKNGVLALKAQYREGGGE